MRRFRLLVCLMLQLLPWGWADAATHSLNLLYIIVDDLSANFEVFGGDYSAPMPNLERLINTSVYFPRAYAQQSICSPSRNSFLSGMRPDTSRVYGTSTSFRTVFPEATSLPQLFKNAGFTTCGVGKVFHDNQPKDHDMPMSWSMESCPYIFPSADHCSDGSMWCSSNTTLEGDNFGFTDGKIATGAIGHMLTFGEDTKPWAIFAGFRKPHTPWVMPQRFLDMQTPLDDIELPLYPLLPETSPVVAWSNASAGDFAAYTEIEKADFSPYNPLPEKLTRLLRRNYFAGASYTDYQIGRLLDALDATGQANNTVVVFHSDHGWQLGEHGGWAKCVNFELGTRVPFTIRIPGNEDLAGVEVDKLVELVDIMPTLADVFNLSTAKVSQPLDGESFYEAIINGSQASQIEFAISMFPRCESSDTTVADGEGPVSDYTFSDCSGVKTGKIEIMGASLRTDLWRYTEWRAWLSDTLEVDWDGVSYGTELYRHNESSYTVSETQEQYNLQLLHTISDLTKQQLSQALRAAFSHTYSGDASTLAELVAAVNAATEIESSPAGPSAGSSSPSWTLAAAVPVALIAGVMAIAVLGVRRAYRRHMVGLVRAHSTVIEGSGTSPFVLKAKLLATEPSAPSAKF